MDPWPRDLMKPLDAPVGRIPLQILETDNRQYLKRWYTHGGLLGPLLGGLFLGASRPFRELHAAVYAVASGVPTVDPLGVCVWRLRGPVHRGAIITQRAYGATNVPEFLVHDRAMDPRQRRLHIERAAHAVRRMHDAGIFHRDLNLANLLVRRPTDGPDTDADILIIDWDRALIRRSIGTLRRIRNLLRMNRSADKFARSGVPISMTDKLRFLRAYCAGQIPWVHRLTLRGPVKVFYVLKWRIADTLYRVLGRAERTGTA